MIPRVRSLATMGLLGLIALLAAETTARVDDWLRLGTPVTHTPDYDRDLKMVDWFGIRGRPNGQYLQWKLNEFGFRGPPMLRDAQAGCTRIMVLGASESFGLYEAPGHEYPAQLRDSLRSHGCFEVVNSAIVGAGLQGQIRLWENYSSKFRPDIVIIYPAPGFYLSTREPDWLPVPGKPMPDPPMPIRPRLIERFRNVWTTPEVLQRRRLERWFAADTAGKPPEWFFRTLPEDRLHAFMRDLDSLVTSIRSRGAEPLLLTHAVAYVMPPKPSDEFLLLGGRRYAPRADPRVMVEIERVAADTMRAYASRRNVWLVDTYSELSGRHELFADGVHFTDLGAATMATRLAREILGKKGPRSAQPSAPLH